MRSQSLPGGAWPDGAFQSSNNVNHNFFEQSQEELREEQVQLHMPFLHDLIRAKILHSQNTRRRLKDTGQEVDEETDDQIGEENTNERVLIQDVEDESGGVGTGDTDSLSTHNDSESVAEEVEGLSYVSQTCSQSEVHTLKIVSHQFG